MNEIIETIKKKLFALEDVLHPYDGGIRMADAFNANSEWHRFVYHLRRELPYSWRYTANCALDGQAEFSELLCKTLRNAIDNAKQVQEELSDLLEYRSTILVGSTKDLSEKLREELRVSSWDNKEIEYYVLIEDRAERLTNVVAFLEETADFLMCSDPFLMLLKVFMGNRKEILTEAASGLKELSSNLKEAVSAETNIAQGMFEHIMDMADEENKKLITWLNENIDAFQMMDLKLHDASFYEYDKLDEEYPLVAKDYADARELFSPFCAFCESCYDQFTDWLAEEKIDWNKMQHQVGRTSSFYLHDEGNFVCVSKTAYQNCVDIPRTLSCIMGELGYEYEDVEYLDNGLIDRESVVKKYPDGRLNLFYIASGQMLREAKEKLEDTIKVYQYIKDVKDNQVAYFKEWLDAQEDILEPKA